MKNKTNKSAEEIDSFICDLCDTGQDLSKEVSICESCYMFLQANQSPSKGISDLIGKHKYICGHCGNLFIKEPANYCPLCKYYNIKPL